MNYSDTIALAKIGKKKKKKKSVSDSYGLPKSVSIPRETHEKRVSDTF